MIRSLSFYNHIHVQVMIDSEVKEMFVSIHYIVKRTKNELSFKLYDSNVKMTFSTERTLYI